MPKNKMPVAHFGARPDDVRAEAAPPKALERWQPEIHAKAIAEGDTVLVIDIMDVIGETWDGAGATSAKVANLLRAAGDMPVIVNINSPGGDVFEGLAIYNQLRVHKGEVTVRVVGLAASAASIIAMAGDRIEVARAGFLMIHNTWVLAVGDRNDLTTVADQLRAFDEVMAELYAIRTGIIEAEISGMMDRETWISGAKSVERGFADSLLPSDQIESRAGAKASTEGMKAIAKIEAGLARAGMPRSERRALIKQFSGKPSAADDGMPGAAESLMALHASVKTALGN